MNTINIKKLPWALPLVSLLVALRIHSGASETKVQPTQKVETTTLQRVSQRARLRLTGSCEPIRKAHLTSQVQGRVERRLKELGEPVQSQEPVLVLDDSQARQQQAQARAGWLQAQAQVQQQQFETTRLRQQVASDLTTAQSGLTSAQSQWKESLSGRPEDLAQAQAQLRAARDESEQRQRDQHRFEELWKEGAISDQVREQKRLEAQLSQEALQRASEQLKVAQQGARAEQKDRALAGRQSAQAQLQLAQTGPIRVQTHLSGLQALQAQSQLREALYRESEILVDRHTIRAPFRGVVLQQQVEVGDLAQPNKPLLEIGDIDRLKVSFDLPEQARYACQIGQFVTLRCPALGQKTWKGRVAHLSPQAESSGRTFRMEVQLDNPGRQLLPQSLMELSLEVGSPQFHLPVPTNCLIHEGPASFVLLVQDGKLERRRVEVQRVEQATALVSGDIHEGDVVALHAFRLRPGMEVLQP